MEWNDVLDGRTEPQLEQILDYDHSDTQPREDSDNDDQHSEAEEAQPQRVVPPSEKKIKIVKNPRAVLNHKRLTGPRGIQTIENVFKDFKFQGKGQEKEDLDMVMKKLEHWAHRLYPKFKFDDCLDKIATLGKKKEVSTHVRKIRFDMLYDHEIMEEDKDEDQDNIEEEPILDEFDLLLNQQIALARSTPATAAKISATTPYTNFDELRVSSASHGTPDGVIEPVEITTEAKSISDAQKERMLQNRIIAEERRLARMKAAMEKSKEAETNTETTDIINA
ncbi:protein TIPIN homolog [Arctopsyche grandis]|uniref:protein TIPIN homolog n=1 Tax=Arctopsyche grandis TaxID=121162 RepID=UPI00406D7C3A